MSAPFVVTEEVQREILKLAAQSDVDSVSCPFDEFELWRGLFTEQVRRAQRLRQPPQEAFCLIGPDSGLPGITPIVIEEDGITYPPDPDPRTGGLAPHMWGGKVHIPYEGTCGAGLFILPKWHNVYPERLTQPGATFRSLVGGKRCNYLLTNRDLGELPCATRSDSAGWFLYKNTAPYPDCNPFRESRDT